MNFSWVQPRSLCGDWCCAQFLSSQGESHCCLFLVALLGGMILQIVKVVWLYISSLYQFASWFCVICALTKNSWDSLRNLGLLRKLFHRWPESILFSTKSSQISKIWNIWLVYLFVQWCHLPHNDLFIVLDTVIGFNLPLKLISHIHHGTQNLSIFPDPTTT